MTTALITAGGTSEPIDDVRRVTNTSSGTFGAEIANALVRAGVDVTVLGSRSMLAHPDRLDPRVGVVAFSSTAELAERLTELTDDPPDLLFMAAAVSDYSPVSTKGKLSSKAETLSIDFVRNPKLLAELRDRCPTSTLVGFKLLSAVSESTLADVARAQVVKNRLNLCVANDQARFASGVHPILLVDETGVVGRSDGSKADAARALVDHVLHPSPPPFDHAALRDAARQDGMPEGGSLMWVDGVPVGLQHGQSWWIAPRWRGRGIGHRLALTLADAGQYVSAPPRLHTFWMDRGFRPIGDDRLAPPDPAQAVRAASIALLDVRRHRVLLGLRQREPYRDTLSFPGGRIEAGETPWDAAVRELAEETGIVLHNPPSSTSHLWTGGAAPVIHIQQFVVWTEDAVEPIDSDELQARWFDLDRATELRPLTPGTRPVLRQLQRDIRSGILRS